MPVEMSLVYVVVCARDAGRFVSGQLGLVCERSTYTRWSAPAGAAGWGQPSRLSAEMATGSEVCLLVE
jgi:hypothetical protein